MYILDDRRDEDPESNKHNKPRDRNDRYGFIQYDCILSYDYFNYFVRNRLFFQISIFFCLIVDAKFGLYRVVLTSFVCSNYPILPY